MLPPDYIRNVWRKFDSFPMETLTKAWFFNRAGATKQRDISLMTEHRDAFGITGNCFDLTFWLLDEFKKAGITAYPIGHDLHTEDAHVAVLALDDSGKRYLCDLGDQWLEPILIDKGNETYTDEKLSGFFPAASVQVLPDAATLTVVYHRPEGKQSKQIYETNEVSMEEFSAAAEHSQNLIKPAPLLECRVPFKNETAHWEFYNWRSFLSTTEGLHYDSCASGIESGVDRIHKVTGYDKTFLEEALGVYSEIIKK